MFSLFTNVQKYSASELTNSFKADMGTARK